MFVLILIAVLFVCLPGLAANDPQQPPNVLLITVDTLRSDHVSCYGYHLRTSPNIDKLASEGVRFDHAHTTIPLTGPAHFSLLTATYPQENGARINGIAYHDKARLLFLPQILRRFGYRNAAFVSAWPLTSRLTHMDEWFDHYDEDLSRSYQMFNSSRYAEDVTPRAVSWMQANEHRPFFMWVHYFDPHEPYHLRESFANPEQIGEPAISPELENDDARQRIREYDSEIGYADYYIGHLLRTLDQMKLRDSTLVVLVADHGESLGEHNYVGHGRQLYDPIVRIPLIMRFPGVIPPGKVVRREVSLLDVAPTMADLAAKPRNGRLELPVPLGGRSLAATVRGGPEPSERIVRFVTFAGRKGFMPQFLMNIFLDLDGLPLKMGHKLGARKVIWTPEDDALEIFDVGKDPYELSAKTPAERTPQYKAEVSRMRRWFKSTAGEEGENRMTAKDMEILKSLGYVQ